MNMLASHSQFQSPVDLDAAIFRMGAEFDHMHRQRQITSKAHNEAEERYFAALPPRPEQQSMSGEARAAFNRLTVSELADGEGDNPYFRERDERIRKEKEELKAWNAACRRVRSRCGLAKAEKAYYADLDAETHLARKALRIKAKTAAGMLEKLRLGEQCYLDENEILEAIAGDIKRLAGQS